MTAAVTGLCCAVCCATDQSHRFLCFKDPGAYRVPLLLPSRVDVSRATPREVRARTLVPSSVCYDAHHNTVWSQYQPLRLWQCWTTTGGTSPYRDARLATPLGACTLPL